MFDRFNWNLRAFCACLALSAATLMLAPEPARGQTPPVAAPATLENLPILRVEIAGNTSTDARAILDQIRAQSGQPYSRALIDLDVKSIASLERFVTVRADIVPVGDERTGTIRGVNVRFVVEERALINGVEIVGNRQFKDIELREGLSVRAGSANDPSRIEPDRRMILDMYHKKGYAQASVDVDQALLTSQGIIRYQIIEGPISKISKIEIDGNVALSDSYIKWRIETKTYVWIFRKGTIDEEKLQRDLAAIRDMYHKKGYLDVRVSYTFDFNEDKSKLVLHFVVLEGMRYKVGQLTLDGNAVFPSSELLRDNHVGPGAWAERDKLELLQHKIEDAYGHEGYIYSKVDIEPAYTDTPGVVDIHIHITEGSPYLVGQVIVRGNTNIQDRVIRRQIRIYPDQTYDMVLVRKSMERLRATRIFQDVRVTDFAAPGDPDNVRSAVVDVAEGQTGKFSFGAGVSTNAGLVGQISLEQQNFDIANPPRSLDEFLRGQAFKGAGQYFRILLEPGTEFQRYRLTFSEPYIFDSPYSFTNDLYYFTRSRESWDERRIGDNVTFGRRLSDIWAVSVALRAEEVTISNPRDLFNDGITQSHFPVSGPNGNIERVSDTAQEILNERGSHFLTSIKPGISYDTTDSQIFPTSGWRAGFSIEQYGAMGGSIDITKLSLNANWYKTLYTDLFDRKTVLAIRNDIGLIPFGSSPTFERFYLGGIGDLRGFRFRGVSPRSGPLSDPIGGDFSWASTAEVNFPVYENLIRGVVFADVGTVEKDITIDSIRSDVGAGVRVSLPFLGNIPVSVDFAYPLTKQSSDLTQLISVSLGLPF